MSQVRAIAGDWMTDGYLDGRGTLRLEIDADGTMWDADQSGGPLSQYYLRQYGRDCPIITNGCWTFAPDASELQRLGLVPTQMIPAQETSQ